MIAHTISTKTTNPDSLSTTPISFSSLISFPLLLPYDSHPSSSITIIAIAIAIMCQKVIVEYKCGHRVLRGNTRCYREDCTERHEEVKTIAEDCAQCEGKSRRWKSTRWCSVGCCICQ